MSVTSAHISLSPIRKERVRAKSQQHWLGVGATPAQKTIAAEIRHQFFETASEYYKAAYSLYDHLRSQGQGNLPARPAFSLVNRNVQLFLAYSILWESFKHIYTAASYTHFAEHGPERDALEDERTQIDRVLRAPILPDDELAKITLLRNGETAQGAIMRIASRSSRELKEFYGIAEEQTLTDMDAFLQGIVGLETIPGAPGQGQAVREHQAWSVRPLDDAGQPIAATGPFTAEKYRSVIKWDCCQIRHNLNFVGKSESSIDDAVLIIRAFCLLDPVVGALLQDKRKALIFAI